MQTTVNYGLKKPEGTDVVNVGDFNTNADIIDGKLKEYSNQFADLIYPTVGGTATAITLTLPTLTNGYSKTFIALANNGGSATTINGVPLYKPGTTTAPNLIAGNAYTVWYNSATPCFFIKASAEGNAPVGNVLAGSTFSNDTDTGLTGTMVNNGAVTITPGATAKTIPQGYHNGSGTVATDSNLLTGNIRGGVTIFGVVGKSSVVETSDGTATAGQMLSGATGYVNGSKITGTIASKVAATYTPGTTAQTIASGQYLSGAQTISGDSNLVTGNIRSGVSIFGISGKSSVVDTADGSAIASQILSGYTAYVNGSKVTGTIPSKGDTTITPGTANQTVTSGQYLSGTITVLGDPDLVASNIPINVNLFGIAGTFDPLSLIPGTAYTLYNDPSAYSTLVITGYTLMKKATCTSAHGTATVAFDLKAGASGKTVYGRIYINDVAVGTARTTTSGTYVAFSEDFAIKDGDVISVYAYSGVSNYSADIGGLRVSCGNNYATFTKS